MKWVPILKIVKIHQGLWEGVRGTRLLYVTVFGSEKNILCPGGGQRTEKR